MPGLPLSIQISMWLLCPPLMTIYQFYGEKLHSRMTLPNLRISNGHRTYALQILRVHCIGFLCFNFALVARNSRVMLLAHSSDLTHLRFLIHLFSLNLASEQWLHFFLKQAISNFLSFYFVCFIVANYLKSFLKVDLKSQINAETRLPRKNPLS